MKKWIFLTIVFLGVLSLDWFLAGPKLAEAGCSDRLQCYIDEVNNERNKYQAAQDKINLTQAQIDSTKAEINSILNTIEDMKQEVVTLQNEINEANNEIREKSLQTKQLFQYLQIADGENMYLEYAFGATDITDLIYRMSMVEQMTDYNDRVIDELEVLIDANEKRTKEIEQKQVEMGEQKKSLDAKIAKLQGEKSSSSEIAVNSQKQIEELEKQIAFFKEKGCEPNDRIGIDCMANSGDVISAAGWYRPTNQGRITQELGYGYVSLDGFHYGLDISSDNTYNEPVYPLANGIVGKTWTDNYGALMLVIYYQDSDGTWYTSQYAHLSRYVGLSRDTTYYPYVTKYVTPNTVVAYMGDSGYAFGVHLHLEFAPCRYGYVEDANCRSWGGWQWYIRYMYDNGFNGVREKVGFPSSWYSR